MHIVISGAAEFKEEVRKKFGPAHEYTYAESHPIEDSLAEKADLIIDGLPADGVDCYSNYLSKGKANILASTLLTSLNQLIPKSIADQGRIYGFCGWPTFIERELMEVTAFDGQEEGLSQLCNDLQTQFRQVSDRVGMASPRVIAMIINEAYYTVQEGTAEKAAIDQAMKLGTNYPYGPFEWADRIGLAHVYDLLTALFEDTGEERYKVCPLLKKEIHEQR